jgi:HlyD family secretion protein
MSVRNSLIVLGLTVLAVPALIFNNAGNADTTAPIVDGPSLQRYTVQRGEVEVSISAVGKVEASDTVDLSMPTPGRIAEVNVKVGDYVQAGDLIARIDNTSQSLAYQQALLSLERAQLELQLLLDPVDADDVRIAQAQVDAAWGNYISIQNAISPEQIRAAQLAYEQAQLIQQNTGEIRAVGGGQGQIADAQYGAASFNTEIARLQLEQLQTANRPELYAAYANAIAAEQRLAQVLAGPPQVQIDAAQLSVERAQANLDRAATAVERTELRAPFNSVIASVNIEVGSLVAPSLIVAQIVQIDPLILRVQVDEIDVSQITPNMPATVRLDALPNVVFPATVGDIAVTGINNSGIVNYPTEILLGNNTDTRIRIGMTAEARVVVQSRADVLVVPNFYIRLDRRRDLAFVNIYQEDGTLREVEVTLGLQGLDNSEITSGLKEGDIIAVDLTGDSFAAFGG